MFAYLRENKLRIKGLFTATLLVVFALVVYFFSTGLVRFLVITFVSIVLFGYVFYRITLFTTSEKGSRITYNWSELVYSLVGIPVLIISIFYLPISLYFVFVNGVALSLMMKSVLLILMIVSQLISLFLFIVRIIKNRKVKEDELFEFELLPSMDYDYVFSPAK
ncbi:MAG: hypothetical protein GOP50_07100 [Candidatus Heimdallarchaeota archaeon]|nr:hypothetical protein [Candidatus Heimdallarchaeota archaeon]